MPRTERPYVRVYYVDLERDYPAIYSDDATAALFLRLLVLSEKAWPIDPELPRSAKAGAIKRLVDSTLIELLPNHHYQSKGYRKERTEREQKAKDAAGERWRQHPPTATAIASADAQPTARANAHPSAMPRTSTSTRTSTKGPPRLNTPRARNGEPLLTKAQLDAWKTFGHEWHDFKDAWLARGFLYPPYGDPEDDDTSQRGLLWSLLDARPTDLVRWIREAPGKSPTEVIGYILGHWHTIRDEAEATVPNLVAHGPNRREAPEHISSIMARLPKAAS